MLWYNLSILEIENVQIKKIRGAIVFLNRMWMNAISTGDVVAHRKPCMDLDHIPY